MARRIVLTCNCGAILTGDDSAAEITVECDQCGSRLFYDSEPGDDFRLRGDVDDIILNGASIEIGRQGPNRVVLDHPKLSRHHCTLRFVTDGYTIVDAGSLNGTFVNQKRLRKNLPLRLRPG